MSAFNERLEELEAAVRAETEHAQRCAALSDAGKERLLELRRKLVNGRITQKQYQHREKHLLDSDAGVRNLFGVEAK